MTLNISLKLV